MTRQALPREGVPDVGRACAIEHRGRGPDQLGIGRVGEDAGGEELLLRRGDLAHLEEPRRADLTADPAEALRVRKERAEILQRVGDTDSSILALEAVVAEARQNLQALSRKRAQLDDALALAAELA